MSRQLGAFDHAESFFEEALGGRRRVLPPGHVDIAITLSYYADLRNAQRRYVEAEALLRESVAIHRGVFPNGSAGTWLAESRLGEALAGQRKFQEAEGLLMTAAAGVVASPELMQIEKRAAIQRLVHLYRVGTSRTKCSSGARNCQSRSHHRDEPSCGNLRG